LPTKLWPVSLSPVTRYGRLELQFTPCQWQKWMLEVQLLKAPYGSLVMPFLKSRSETRSILLPWIDEQQVLPTPKHSSSSGNSICMPSFAIWPLSYLQGILEHNCFTNEHRQHHDHEEFQPWEKLRDVRIINNDGSKASVKLREKAYLCSSGAHSDVDLWVSECNMWEPWRLSWDTRLVEGLRPYYTGLKNSFSFCIVLSQSLTHHTLALQLPLSRLAFAWLPPLLQRRWVRQTYQFAHVLDCR